MGEFELRTTDGKKLGDGSFAVIRSLPLNYQARVWKEQTQVTLLEASGIGKKGVVATVGVHCHLKNCSTSKRATHTLTETRSSNYYFDESMPRGLEAKFAQKWDWVEGDLVLSHPAAVNGPEPVALTPTKWIRCDSTPYVTDSTKGGCIYGKFTPTFHMSRKDKKIDAVAIHVWEAERHLKKHWGWEGHGPVLKRTMSKKLKKDNRDKACPKSRKPPKKGLSCDEYPFASTEQGASKNPDFSWKWVPLDKNVAQGRDYLLKFYKENRILNSDPFWVAVS